jgi:acetyl-CoA acetyltransferase
MRNPIRDEVAIVGLGSTGFSRDAGDKSCKALACEASIAAIQDAGISREDINGIVASNEPGGVSPNQMAATLGISDVTHFSSPTAVALFSLVDAVNAIFSGSCDTILMYFTYQRLPWNSRSAASDPFRRYTNLGTVVPVPETPNPSAAYTAWASRYIHEYDIAREDFGRVALNMRANAARNPLAAMTKPLTMDDYLNARMIRDPLCMLDMDIPVDGADAFILTTTEKAKKITDNPVVIHAATVGLVDKNDEDQLPDLSRHGQHVVVETLKAKSDVWLDDVDVFLPYDGFSIITLGWIENLGWCKPGQAGTFLKDHWDDKRGSAMINGRIPINPHGGSLSEGATRGSGHLREAVEQLRGSATEDRLVKDAKTALIGCGGFFFNSQGAILKRL